MSEKAQQSKTKKDDWRSPARLLDPILLHDNIDTDPCADPDRQFARINHTEADNGLSRPWEGVAFVNNPFSEKVRWAEEVEARFKSGEIDRAYLVSPDSTSHQSFWHQYVVPNCSVSWFPEGRVKYLDESGEEAGSPSFGSAVSVFGTPPLSLVKAWRERGDVVIRPQHLDGSELKKYAEL